jgi:hypothetical protein
MARHSNAFVALQLWPQEGEEKKNTHNKKDDTNK